MLARRFTRVTGTHLDGVWRNVLVASFRWCRRSVAEFEAEEAMTI